MLTVTHTTDGHNVGVTFNIGEYPIKLRGCSFTPEKCVEIEEGKHMLSTSNYIIYAE